MSRFKKIFVVIASFILVATSTFIISICNIKSNVCVAVGEPYSAAVFYYSTSGTEIKDDEKAEKLEKEISNLTNLTVYNKLINGATLDKRIYLDTDGKFSKYTTDLLTNNLVVEFIYNSMQDLIVYDGEDSRVVSYYCISYVIPKTKGFTEIAVYYSLTSNADGNEKNESYASNTPFVLCGNAESLVEFITGLYSND